MTVMMNDSVATEARRQTSGTVLDTDKLLTDLRTLGLDLGRNLCMTYLVWFGSSRDAAFEGQGRAERDGWRATLHGDGTGWVVRLSRHGPARTPRLRLDAAWVERFAAELGGLVRGVAVEDLSRPGYWDVLAARSVDRVRSADRSWVEAGPQAPPILGVGGPGQVQVARSA
jgi:hypothetical protein